MDCLTSKILLQKACSYKCQFCIKYVTFSRLIDGWIKYKGKVPDVPDPSQNVERMLKQHCNFKLKLTKLKDLFIKRGDFLNINSEKLSKKN